MPEVNPLIPDSRRFDLAAGVILQPFEGKGLLLNLGSEQVYQLNETGTRVASLLSEGRSLREILDVLQGLFAVSPNEMEGDVRDLLRDLLAEGLVVEKTE